MGSGAAAEGERIVEERRRSAALGERRWRLGDSVFTSLEALQQAVEDEQSFVVMPARTLFAMTLGETLFLNAKLATGKEFMPNEIRHLLGKRAARSAPKPCSKAANLCCCLKSPSHRRR